MNNSNKINWHTTGNEEIKKLLEKYIEKDCIPHSMVLTGSRGTGKTSLAIEFAHLLLCEGEKKICGKCRYCRFLNYEMGNIVLLKNEGPITIDEIRKWKKDLSKSDYGGKFRVMIVVDVEKMTKEAANAFLKLLEEPGKKIIFLLLTSKLRLVMDTIKSRSVICHIDRAGSGYMDANISDGGSFSKSEIKNLAMGRMEMVEIMKNVSKERLVENVIQFWRLVYENTANKRKYIGDLIKNETKMLKVLVFWEGCVRDLIIFRELGGARCWWQDEKLFELYEKVKIDFEKLVGFIDALSFLRVNIKRGYVKKNLLFDCLIELYIRI